MMKLSVVIPTYNEEKVIADTIKTVQEIGGEHLHEILVVDRNSTDKTFSKAEAVGAKVIKAPAKGRAAQMNYGAEQAEGEVLYFLHADSKPPTHFDRRIIQAVSRGFETGCFRLAFDENHFMLDFYAWCTRFDIDAFRFGDQSLFIERSVFFELGGFKEDHLVMEDNEMVRRIKDEYSFIILSDFVETSARAYRKVGIVKLQVIFVIIYLLYFMGVDQEILADIKRHAIA
jgi:rSAM/selenodomain-associated transferase 2